MRAARWLADAAEKLASLPTDRPPIYYGGLKGVLSSVRAASNELNRVYESCLDARNAYASHPRIRKQLIAVTPIIKQYRDRAAGVADALDVAPKNAKDWAQQIALLAAEITEVSFVPQEYKVPTPDPEDAL